MSTGFADYAFAAEFRDTIVRIAQGVVNEMRPESRVAEVVAINKENLTADVKVAGDQGSFAARFGLSLQPREAGNLVRVTGRPGNYYITEILNDTGLHEEYEPVKDQVGSIGDNGVWVFRQPNEPTHEDPSLPPGRGLKIGDVWYDTDDGNHMRTWDGIAWVELDYAVQADLDAALAAAQAYTEQRIIEETAGIDTDIANAQAAAQSYADDQLVILDSDIQADIENATSVITGSLIQTVTDSQRGIKIVSDAWGGYGVLVAYNSANEATFVMRGDTGDVTMKGSLTAGSSITGASFTSGVIQTHATASRGIKIVGNEGGFGRIVGYNGSGTTLFSINSDTGTALFMGEISSGSTISGALISGPLKTSSLYPGLNRGIVVTNSGIFGYDSVAGSPTLGQVTFGISSSTGAVTVKGSIVSGSSINGATVSGTTINGGTINTATLNSVVINTSEFHQSHTATRVGVDIDEDGVTIKNFAGSNIFQTTSAVVRMAGTVLFDNNAYVATGVEINSGGLRINNGGMTLYDGINFQLDNGAVQWTASSNMAFKMRTISDAGTSVVLKSDSVVIGVANFNSASPTSNNTETLHAADIHSWTGGLWMEDLSGGGGTTATITNAGRIIRTVPSSERYKEEVQTISVEKAKLSLELESVTFKYIPEVDMGDIRYPGVIAEQAQQLGLDEWIVYGSDGQVEGFRYQELPVIHNVLIQDLYNEIAALKAQLN